MPIAKNCNSPGEIPVGAGFKATLTNCAIHLSDTAFLHN